MKKFSEKILYEGKWLCLKESLFINSKNENIFWESIERKNNVVSFAIIACLKPSNRYVFIKQFRQAINNYVIGLPAGILDTNAKDERGIKQCVLKELKEETGYIGKYELRSPMLKLNPAILNHDFFIAQVDIDEFVNAENNQQNLEASEEIEVVPLKKDEIEDFLIKESKKGISIASGVWFLYNQI